MHRILVASLAALLLLGAGLTLAGCGQKGDLYLPDEPQDFQRRAAP
jgi:predicted small lipoprotein YifL